MKIVYLLCAVLLNLSTLVYGIADATLMGRVDPMDGLGRIPFVFYSLLKKSCNVNFYLIPRDIARAPYEIRQKVVGKDEIGNILIFSDMLWTTSQDARNILPKAGMSIAYSMLESSKIPKKWVEILNERFDMVVVPDETLVKVYKDSGVLTPVFVLPLAVDLDEFYNAPIKKKQNTPFIFGTSATFYPRKNHIAILEGFIKAFGNNMNVKFLIHGKAGSSAVVKKLQDMIHAHDIKNVELIHKKFDKKKHIEFLRGLDCYVLGSHGEGFSITPREALALGIPCILSDNTAHRVICKNDFVRAIPFKKRIKASVNILGHSDIGFYADSDVKEISQAFMNMYTQYEHYLAKAEEARQWAMGYSYASLLPYYVSLVRPNSVFLGDANIIEKDYIMTDNLELYNKYQAIEQNHKKQCPREDLIGEFLKKITNCRDCTSKVP